MEERDNSDVPSVEVKEQPEKINLPKEVSESTSPAPDIVSKDTDEKTDDAKMPESPFSPAPEIVPKDTDEKSDDAKDVSVAEPLNDVIDKFKDAEITNDVTKNSDDIKEDASFAEPVNDVIDKFKDAEITNDVTENSDDIQEVAPSTLPVKESETDIKADEVAPSTLPVKESETDIKADEVAPSTLPMEENEMDAKTDEVSPSTSLLPEECDMKPDDMEEVPPPNSSLPEECDMKPDDMEEVPSSVPKPDSNDVNEKSDDNKENINAASNRNDEEVPMEVVKDDESVPARICIKGFENDDAECCVMTVEEAYNYILKKVESNLRDPNINPILIMRKRIADLKMELQAKSDEMSKVNKMCESLWKDQVKFLRHMGVMPKIETKTVGIGVDFPWVAETVPGFFPNDMKTNPENLIPPGSGVTITAVKPKKDTGPVECIDLTDDPVVPQSTSKPKAVPDMKNVIITKSPAVCTTPVSNNSPKITRHPAPLPSVSSSFTLDPIDILPKPRLKISVDKNGIVLQWDMPPEAKNKKITGFEIFGYREKNTPISSLLWKKIGCVNPMPLPMSCTLTQFVEGYKYHFSIRAISNEKLGHFSDAASIMFVPNEKTN